MLTSLLVSCGTTRKSASAEGKANMKDSAARIEEKDPLTPEQRRKYDYFFLEAVRMKQKGDYDAAFQLYSHCLDIYPQSAAVLYEISQFYMFLGQDEKGEKALKDAVRSDDHNFWYKQTLASYYQSKQDWIKLLPYMRIWHRYSRHVSSRFCRLSTCTTVLQATTR